MKFCNLPFKADRSDYQNVVDTIVQYAKRNRSILSVYLMGGEWYPGISDLDIVLVYKDENEPLDFPKKNDKTEKIFTHRCLSFHKDDFKNFFFFYPTSNIRLLFGEDLNPINLKEKYSNKEYKMLLALNLIDYLIHKMAILPFKYKGSKNFDVRQRIAELKSLSYDFEIIEYLGFEHSHKDFLDKIKELRLNWFNLNRNLEILKELSQETESVIFNLLELISDYLYRQDLFQIEFNDCKFVNRDFKIKFIKNYEFSTFKRNKIGLRLPIIKGGRINLNFPASSSILFFIWKSNKNTNFSKLINNRFSGVVSGKQLTSNFIDDYTNAKNLIFDRFVKTNGFYRAPFLLGFSGFDLKHNKLSLIISLILSILRQ